MGGVENGRGQRAHAVEDDLGQEEPQQEGAQTHLGRPHRGVVDVRGQEPHDPGPGDDAHHHHRPQPHQAEGQHRARQPFRVLVAAAVEQGHEHGHQGGREQAGGDHVEEDVRDQVCALVGVAQKGRAHGRTHGQHPHEAADPRHRVPGGDGRGRPQQGGRGAGHIGVTADRGRIGGRHGRHGRGGPARDRRRAQDPGGSWLAAPGPSP